MDDVIKNALDKISSYDIFNNFFPGVVFCYMTEHLTQIKIANESVLENLFVFYFIGLVISRIGSVWIEYILRKIKVKNKQSKIREVFLKRVSYQKYEEAAKAKPKIEILSEKNNVYRTMLALLIVLLLVKLYDVFLYSWVNSLGGIGQDAICIFVCSVLIILFLFSYKKQTEYITNSVENYFIKKV